MENTSIVALSRQTTLRRQLGVIANNLANMNTTGFKGGKMMFIEHLVRSRGGDSIIGDKIAYVRDIATVRDLSEGGIKATGNPLDLAIQGDGYFVIDTPTGEQYTRNGSFRLDQEGQLVTKNGDPVLSDGGDPFFFTPTESKITVSRDGTVSTSNGQLGRMRTVRFENQYALKETAGGLFTSEAPPQDIEIPNIVQNALESSNVEPIIEMTRLIETHRTYKSVQKLMDAENERLKKMIREVANPGNA
ncbi:MAG: flagellar basal-body rod protein FlgF [Rhodospirillales bacterium]|nr:flagellar basal-body rod protein FlgF [Rhodospirillales bacterium]